MIKTIYWENGIVKMLDQSRLPLETIYVDCDDYIKVAEGIQKLWIRGAPAIGIAAAMGLALGASDLSAETYEEFIKKLAPVRDSILATRPTAVNIQWAMEHMFDMLEKHRNESIEALKKRLKDESQKILEEDIEINRAIGEAGASFIRDGDTILTHCNAGSLATGGYYGTATAAIRVAHEQGKKIKVIADETRPVLQGARLTAWELMEDGIDVTLISDVAAGSLMLNGEVDLVIVGTDRTVRNGDVANKIGTYPVAVLAAENGIPFYVAAPLSSIDLSIKNGAMIPIEERDSEEVTNVFGRCRIAPEGVKVRNPAFDVTPARYVAAFFTEKGAFRPSDLKKLKDPAQDLEAIRIDTVSSGATTANDATAARSKS